MTPAIVEQRCGHCEITLDLQGNALWVRRCPRCSRLVCRVCLTRWPSRRCPAAEGGEVVPVAARSGRGHEVAALRAKQRSLNDAPHSDAGWKRLADGLGDTLAVVCRVIFYLMVILYVLLRILEAFGEP